MAINILESCTYYKVDLRKIPADTRETIIKDAGLEKDQVFYTESGDNLEYYHIPADAVNWESAYFEEDELVELLREYLNVHKHYLVFAKNCTWNGSSGYTFCDDIAETCYRDYDITLILEKTGKDAILCTESSHDVPCGAPTYIVGLSEKEYDKLQNASFDEIEKFVLNKF